MRSLRARGGAAGSFGELLQNRPVRTPQHPRQHTARREEIVRKRRNAKGTPLAARQSCKEPATPLPPRSNALNRIPEPRRPGGRARSRPFGRGHLRARGALSAPGLGIPREERDEPFVRSKATRAQSPPRVVAKTWRVAPRSSRLASWPKRLRTSSATAGLGSASGAGARRRCRASRTPERGTRTGFRRTTRWRGRPNTS
mmetsp:Transcript_32689/g.100700  ORF Transcript_32689/g.100700 Transcript_32689/m.100700 type:complete len:200 (+) Transcript_32689:199-798(+)